MAEQQQVVSDPKAKLAESGGCLPTTERSPASAIQTESCPTSLLEPLSALVDDEAETFELRRLIRSMPADPQLLARFRRYQAVRSAVSQGTAGVSIVDLSPRIRQSLTGRVSDFPQVSLVRRSGLRTARMLGQVAVAASVALAVLLSYSGLRPLPAPGSGVSVAQVATEPPAITKGQALPQLNGDYNTATVTRTVSLDQAARSRLERAVRNFSGTSAVINSGETGMFPAQLQPFRPTVSTPTAP